MWSLAVIKTLKSLAVLLMLAACQTSPAAVSTPQQAGGEETVEA
jgi:uncharacterized lipoprotein YajG